MSDDDWDDDYGSDYVEDDDDPYDDDGNYADEEEVVEEEDEDDEDVNQTEYVEEIDDDNCSDAEGQTDDGDLEHSERGTGSMSNYEYAKPWGGTGGFMDSYGIERTPEGYQEANELVDTMREAAEREGDDGRRK